MQLNKKSFILYTDSLNVLDDLSDEDAGKIFKAIHSYHSDGTYQLDGLLNAVFTPFKTIFEKNEEKYQSVVERNKENGKKGGHPPKKGKPRKTRSVFQKPRKTQKTQWVFLKPKQTQKTLIMILIMIMNMIMKMILLLLMILILTMTMTMTMTLSKTTTITITTIAVSDSKNLHQMR